MVRGRYRQWYRSASYAARTTRTQNCFCCFYCFEKKKNRAWQLVTVFRCFAPKSFKCFVGESLVSQKTVQNSAELPDSSIITVPNSSELPDSSIITVPNSSELPDSSITVPNSDKQFCGFDPSFCYRVDSFLPGFGTCRIRARRRLFVAAW